MKVSDENAYNIVFLICSTMGLGDKEGTPSTTLILPDGRNSFVDFSINRFNFFRRLFLAGAALQSI